MQKIYFFVQLALLCIVFPNLSQGQNCITLGANFTAYESRCAATGSITVHAFGGSGSYKYKTTGAVNSNYTTSDSITGLSAGIYSVVINDLITNCTYTLNNVVVPGSYQDPRFTLTGIHVSCDNGNNGNITVNGQQFGRSPFSYSIVSPSPMGVGTTNTSGIFNNLVAGDYSVRMMDSCGGIQTRSITIDNYTWWIDSYSASKLSCDSASAFIKVIDSRGNVSTLGTLPGFIYGIVRFPGDTIWSSNPNFKFYLAGTSSVDIIAKDGCGTIKKGNASLHFNPSIGGTVNVTDKACSTFTASLTNQVNFFNVNFCLYGNNNVLINCNSTGIFYNVPYGSYVIKAHELCPDTIITRSLTVAPPTVSIANLVNITNKNCNTFSASITGQVGLTNPSYCLFNAANVSIACNTTGVFNNLAYGSYCINTTDSCRDTTIVRCFIASKPRPIIPVVLTPSYVDCRNVIIIVGGDSLYSPQYCLYDTSGVLITCNNTGTFDSLTVGNHCVTVYDACYDTTITRCFSVGAGVIVNDLMTTISNKNCSTFTVKANSNNLIGAQFCLYTAADSLIRCNSMGVFDSIVYGSYCIKAKNPCPDTLFTNCFTVNNPVPSVSNTVNISNRNCATFTAKITSQQNLTNPQYCIYDSNNVQISCNSTGIFNNLNYGSYCIKVINTCYDTTLTRCFNTAPKIMGISVTASKSCSYGFAKFSITATNANLPLSVKIFRPDGSLLMDTIHSSSTLTIDSLYGTSVGQTYNIIATDNCGSKDSVSIGATASIATHTATVFAQCPSAAWLNGSGKLELNTATNMGIFTVRIIKKDGVTLVPDISPNAVSGGVFTYNDLGAGTYIVSYKLNDFCNSYQYDTVNIGQYYYPNLNRSSAYQCDVNGFSVGAVASNGVGPFSYEIIGSNPSFPSINAAPQSNPIFTINNGVTYSLIRLRALDACGNATLGDASILPLANYRIDVDSNCFQSSSTLSVDTIFNSTYAWYKKDKVNSTDSTYLGGGYSVYIPFLSAGDTGIYICQVTVNTGCVKRSYVYNLNGLCYQVLPVKITALSGKFVNDRVNLNWSANNESDLKRYVVERKNTYGKYTEIGQVKPALNASGSHTNEFIDLKPGAGINLYRLKLMYTDHSFTYSNSIQVNRSVQRESIHCYPNPVTDMLNIDFATGHPYRVSLRNIVNQGLWEATLTPGSNNSLQISRPKSISQGIYTLKCVDLITAKGFSEKIIFL